MIRRMGCRRKTIVAVPNNRRHWAVVRRAGSSALIASKRGVVRTARAGTTRADHRSALQRDGGGCERIALSCRRPPTAQRPSRVRVHPAHTAAQMEGKGRARESAEECSCGTETKKERGIDLASGSKVSTAARQTALAARAPGPRLPRWAHANPTPPCALARGLVCVRLERSLEAATHSCAHHRARNGGHEGGGG